MLRAGHINTQNLIFGTQESNLSTRLQTNIATPTLRTVRTCHVEVPKVVLIRNTRIRIDLHAHLVDRTVQKQPAIRVEQLGANHGEKLSGDATSIQRRLAQELKTTSGKIKRGTLRSAS
jgi:hypothetical protein